MLSGVGPKNHLKRFGIPVLLDLPVGDNYKVHPEQDSSTLYNPLTVHNLEQYYFQRSGILSEVPVLALYLNTKSNSDKNWPNAKITFTASPFISSIQGIFISLQKVKSRGTIRLQSVSPYISPVITSNLLSDPRDFEDAIDLVKFFLYLTQLPQIQPLTSQNFLESAGCQSCPGVADYLCDSGIECFIRRSTTTTHSGCSCRMGAVERNDVVVDPCLRVKNARNLRVCDASIFPDLPNANINAAIHMVGEKCADLILQDHFTK